MLVLAIDTATTDLVTGLVDTETGQAVDRVIGDTRAHNEQLIPTIEALLAGAARSYADLDAIVVGTGPGPFTGLRVGMATASALGVALSLPVHGVCTLDAINRGVAARGEGTRLVAIDARRKEVYWAIFQGEERLAGPGVTRPEDLLAAVEEAAGEAAGGLEHIVIPEAIAPRLPEQLAGLPREWATPRAAGLVGVAQLDCTPEPLVPLYLRRPDAVPPKPKPRSSALPDVAGLL
ncbi:tRNA (adenosine(37)-N6)-threonylcarbamoyltransferase complex dimerization subunit type 1 TsaB [Corynebacterium sp.]|uniref:tRNA (adenosine(37)-N6)-threonylcarbamoyltransferase complex dimerization subunit type 1 TsaB n=1 Tax=Corynebacterium sp. TaxID=1720 RepID=UPI0026DD4082|nr:tRNA (adenosine(37)-N6)-threonylcarbamoyltransferase complex dimerization subunit type 1 TsaB [Corynebacterium sp.]MDO5031256.1 tRNA (adenosine(37)-N6)-threonylcarbamoyltransferase complex dimerization subunit type 1 TsaB [Corynebacterium sp.]